MIKVAFIVNGDYMSAMGFRARDLAARLSNVYDIHIVYRSRRKIISILRLFTFLLRERPAASYVFDISYTGVLGAGLYKLLWRNCLIIETGDAIVELVRSTGSRGKTGLWLTHLLEQLAFQIADRIVVRGSYHQRWLKHRGIEAEVIQDGVNTQSFTDENQSDLREQYNLEGLMTVGLVGSSVWSEKLQMCYGWELVEVLRLLKERPVKGIMIGGGTGVPHLKARCREYGIEDKIIFLGHVPYEELPRYLNLIDICLSTQTNNLVGQVRTTGKLPLYLAAGRYVLASNVGEAAIVLDKEMLVEYEGVKDCAYPQKLSERVQAILDQPEILKRSVNNVTLAREHFDYNVLAERMAQLINVTIKRQRQQ